MYPVHEKIAVTIAVAVIVGVMVVGVRLQHLSESRAAEPERISFAAYHDATALYLSYRDGMAEGILRKDYEGVRMLLAELRVRLEAQFASDFLHSERMMIIDYLLRESKFDVRVLGGLDAVFD